MESSDEFFSSFESTSNRKGRPPPPAGQQSGGSAGTAASSTAAPSLRRPPPQRPKPPAAVGAPVAASRPSKVASAVPPRLSNAATPNYYGTAPSVNPITAANSSNPVQTQRPESSFTSSPVPASSVPSARGTGSGGYYGAAQQTSAPLPAPTDWSNTNATPQAWNPASALGSSSSSAATAVASNPYASSVPSLNVAPSHPQQQPTQFMSSGQSSISNTSSIVPSNSAGWMMDSSFAAQQQQPLLQGSMDQGVVTPTIFAPQPYQTTPSKSKPTSMGYLDLENEPPLLEELGINLEHIYLKTKAVVLPIERWNKNVMDPDLIVQDADLAGPLALALLLGGELLFSGKIQFGYIYGFGLFGCLSMTLMLNLMAKQAVSVWTVASILGYALLPVNLLAAVKILIVNLANLSSLGRLLGLLTVLWSTVASTRLLEVGCGMSDQRYLIAFPIAMLYSAFVLITIF